MTIDGDQNAEPSTSTSTKSFAEMMNNFNKLTEMESRIEAAIENSKVPWQETRKFLKGLDLNQVLNTPLAQFISDLFSEIGLGNLELSDKNNYRFIYRIKNCPVCGLFKDVHDKHVCQPTADAICRFFSENMGLDGEVKETKCVNTEDEYCEFRMDLQPFAVLEKALDRTDIDILNLVNDNGSSMEVPGISDKLELDEDEVRARLTLLQYYEILDANNHITQVGKTFYDYRKSNPFEEEEAFDPPWKSMTELTSTIAATQSFAEALVVLSEEEELPWESDDSELIDIRERAKDKASFAELLLSEVKTEDEEEEEE
jgi:predicted hydrocarbon binding protein